MKTETLTLKSGISGLPREIQIIPFGRHETERGAFMLDEGDAERIMADFDARENDMVIDYEHQTLSGGEAPAAGWIKRLKFVPSGAGARGPSALAGLWAVVEWTPRAAEYLKNREYRYLSPVFLKRLSDNKVFRLINAALTNQPAIDGMVPVVNRARPGASFPVRPNISDRGSAPTPPKEDNPPSHSFSKVGMGGLAVIPAPGKETVENSGIQTKEVSMKKLLELLGLAPEATEEQAITAVQAMKEEIKTLTAQGRAICDCLGLAEGVPLSEVRGTVMALKQANGQLSELADLKSQISNLKSEIAQRDASELVAQAMKSGKVTPAQREWAQGYAETDPEGFRVFVSKAPVVLEMGEVTPSSPLALGGGLEETQLQVNRLLAVDEEAYRKHNKKEG